jgi:hypothetical protein
MAGFRHSSISMYYQEIGNLLGGSRVSHLHLFTLSPNLPRPSILLCPIISFCTANESFYFFSVAICSDLYLLTLDHLHISPDCRRLGGSAPLSNPLVLAHGVSWLQRQTDVGCRYSTQWHQIMVFNAEGNLIREVSAHPSLRPRPGLLGFDMI